MCADAAWAMPLAVAIRSIEDSQPEDRSVHVTVLSMGLDDATRDRVVAGLQRVRVTFVDARALIPSDVPTSKARYTRAIYGRLFAPELVDVPSARLIYLDTDVLVQDDLAFLERLDLGGRAIAAAQDASQPVLSVRFPDWRVLGLPPGAPYFNSGVLVIDVNTWCASGIRPAALDFLYRCGNGCLYPDQDALNAVIRGRFARLPARWNQDAAFRHPRHLAYAFLDEAEVDAAERAPAIVHFTGRLKPWLPGCHDPAAGAWRQALASTAYRGFTVQESRVAALRAWASRIPLARRAVQRLRRALR